MSDLNKWARMEELMCHTVSEELAVIESDRPRVRYSAFPMHDDSISINNLHEVAVEGKCVFVDEYGYCSELCEDPTWLEVAVMADDKLGVNNEHCEIFLENVRQIDEDDGIKTIVFVMGS